MLSENKKYSKSHGPWMLLPHAKEIANKLEVPYDQTLKNCQLAFHLVYKNFGIQLPQLWSQELYEDDIFFEEVKKKDRQYIGDTYLFKPFNDKIFDPKRLHIAVGTGQFLDQKPVLIHASFYENTITVWHLDRFIKPEMNHNPKYQLVGIRRLKPINIFMQIYPSYKDCTISYELNSFDRWLSSSSYLK
jgi:hypothetical protein